MTLTEVDLVALSPVTKLKSSPKFHAIQYVVLSLCSQNQVLYSRKCLLAVAKFHKNLYVTAIFLSSNFIDHAP